MDETPNNCDCVGCKYRSILFEGLSSQELTFMCRNRHTKKISKGENIITEGDTIDEFIYLKNGLVKLFQHDKSHGERIIRIAKAYDFVSLLTVFSDNKYHFSISAIEDSVICMIKLDAIKTLIKSNGNLALKIMEKMSINSDSIIQNNIEINKRNLRGRIAYVLALFADEIYKKNEFDLPITRKEIGQLINMSTENVIRILSELRKDKFIRINGKNIEITDYKMIKKISELG